MRSIRQTIFGLSVYSSNQQHTQRDIERHTKTGRDRQSQRDRQETQRYRQRHKETEKKQRDRKTIFGL